MSVAAPAVATRTRELLDAPIVPTLLRLAALNVVGLAAGTRYLRIVGPTYGFFGLGLALYAVIALAFVVFGTSVALAVRGGAWR